MEGFLVEFHETLEVPSGWIK